MSEWLGAISLVLAVYGVWLNNRRDVRCFPVWLVGTAISFGLHLHAYAGGAAMGSLALRDACFLVLNVDGWRRWRRPLPEARNVRSAR